MDDSTSYDAMPELISSDDDSDDDDDDDYEGHADSDTDDDSDTHDPYQTALLTEWLLDCAAHSHCTSNPSNLYDIQDLL